MLLSGKTVKLILYEALQFAALCVPVFVVMERFATLMHDLRGHDPTAYWLVVAASVAYVTSVTLLVWVPLKYVILKQRRFITEITQWRPTALAYVLLCTLPCFAIFVAGSKVQVDGGHRFDHFSELPVSLVLFSLICVDIIDRIRPCNLTGKGGDGDVDSPGPVLTHLEQVSTVSGQLYSDRGQNGSPPGQPEVGNGTTGGWRDQEDDTRSHSTVASRSANSTAYLYASRPRSYSGPLQILWARDGRAAVFVDSFLFWLDTVEMLRVAGQTSVFYSAWVFPVFILVFLSILRMVVTPQNPLLCSAGVLLQDLPFLAVRVALIAVFGYVTPVLYPMKNLLVCLTYVYFTFLTKLKIFKRESMF